jgi:hypothetical protein
MSFMDRVRYKLGRWRARRGAYRSEFATEVSRAVNQNYGSMTSGPEPGARYDEPDKSEHDESGAEH